MAASPSLSLAILGKIGAPLMAAVGDVAARGVPTEKPQAEQLAALIGKAVQTGIGLAGSMDLRDAADADAIRLALSAIAAPLDWLELRELLLPIAQHVRFDGAQVAYLANGEVALGRNGRQVDPLHVFIGGHEGLARETD